MSLHLFFHLYYFLHVGRIESFKNIDNFGERLKLARLYFQATQRDLADLIDLNQGTLTKIERNVFVPEKDAIEKLSNTFSLNPLFLQYGQAPIFSKKVAFGDFVIADRNRKLQNLFSGEALDKIILYLLGKEQVREGYIVSGKPLYDVFIFVSHLKDPHYLVIRTDIEAGSTIRETLKQHNLTTSHVKNAALLEAFGLIYHTEYQFPHYKNFMDALGKIDIPRNMHFLREFPENEIMAPFIIAERDRDIIDKLLEFFITNKINEKDIRAAMKHLKEIRKSEK